MFLEFIGHFGALMLSICAIPQLYTTLVTKQVQGLSYFSLLTWGAGCIAMTVYVSLTTQQIPLLINYAFNSVVVTTITILYYKYRK